MREGDIHVCTNDSLAAGLEDIPLDVCPICGNKTLQATWVDWQCRTCHYSPEHPASIGNARKNYCKANNMKRADWASMMGYKPRTITQYEDQLPSDVYLEKCKPIFKKFFAS